MVTRVQAEGRSSPTTGLDSDVCARADDHALLLRGVQRRASSVLALAAARTWPYAELDTLTGFLRTAVLPQVTDEEDGLSPGRVSAPFAQLSAQHAHIRALTELLEHADATSCALSELRRLVDGECRHGLRRVHQRIDGDRDLGAPGWVSQAASGRRRSSMTIGAPI